MFCQKVKSNYGWGVISMSEFFLITHQSSYVIYGAGKNGLEIADLLSNAGFNVLTLIDTRADEICCDITKYKISSLHEFRNFNYDDCILIITLNNGLIHEEIANFFFEEYGITKIIYLPMSDNLSDYKKQSLRRAYIDLKNGCLNINKLPIYKQYNHKYKVIDDYSDEWISFWFSVENLYTVDTKPADNTTRYDILYEKILDIPILSLTIYKDLFRYFSDKSVDLSNYYAFQCGSQRDKQKILSDRLKLYSIYERQYKYGLNFFTSSPGHAVYDSSSHKVRLVDGMHRSFYLISKGHKEVPIYMSKKDFILMRGNDYMEQHKVYLKEVDSWEDIFSNNSDILIYGAGKTAEKVFFEIKDKNEQWANQIKGFLVTDLTQNSDKLIGLPVYQADEYDDRSVYVIIPHMGLYRKQIFNHLHMLGYLNYASIARLREIEIINSNLYKNNPYSKIGLENYDKKTEEEKEICKKLVKHIYKELNISNADFGGVIPYQSLELIGLEGRRPTTYRVLRYGLNDILSSDMTVLDIGCNTGFIDITIADKVKKITGIEYDSNLASICRYVSEELNINNYNVENQEFSNWYKSHNNKKYDAVLSFAIHHWLNINSIDYSNIIDNLLNDNGYLWLESHDNNGGDAQYFEIIELLKQKKYRVIKDEQIADDCRNSIESARRFVLMQKSYTKE